MQGRPAIWVVSDAAAMIAGVPRISAFYGILITMYWLDHPPPHFHAAYAGHVARSRSSR